MKQTLVLLLTASLLSACVNYQSFNSQNSVSLSSTQGKTYESEFGLPFNDNRVTDEEDGILDISSIDSDTIKLKDGSIIVADIYSSNLHKKPENGVIGYRIDKDSEKLTISGGDIDTIIYDNKIQTKHYVLTIDPELMSERQARSSYRKQIVYMIMGIVMIPILAFIWAVLVAVFALFWGIGWLFTAIFGSPIEWPDSSYFIISFLIALGIGAIGTLIFLLVSNSIKKKPGVISKIKK